MKANIEQSPTPRQANNHVTTIMLRNSNNTIEQNLFYFSIVGTPKLTSGTFATSVPINELKQCETVRSVSHRVIVRQSAFMSIENHVHPLLLDMP